MDVQTAGEARGTVTPEGTKTTAYTESQAGLDMAMVWIEGGSFKMGDRMSSSEIIGLFREPGKTEAKGGFADAPLHRVALDGFWIGKTEVTVGQFRRFAEAANYRTGAEKAGKAIGLKNGVPGEWEGLNWRNPGFAQTESHPVVYVSWNDAKAFCEWLSQKTGNAYTLPTEAQWEYACRAGTTTEFQWGDDPKKGEGWSNGGDRSLVNELPDSGLERSFDWEDGYAYTAPVGQFKPNAWGLYDMHGNAREWCLDWYGGDYYSHSPKKNPQGPDSGTTRVARGCFWGETPIESRSSVRTWLSPEYSGGFSGFRVCRVVVGH